MSPVTPFSRALCFGVFSQNFIAGDDGAHLILALKKLNWENCKLKTRLNMHNKSLPQKNITDILKIWKLVVKFDLFYPAKSLYFPTLGPLFKSRVSALYQALRADNSKNFVFQGKVSLYP